MRTILSSAALSTLLLTHGLPWLPGDILAQQPGRPNVADSAATLTVVDDDNVCSTCLALNRIAVLGDDDGPGYLEESQWAAADSRGNYWVLQPGPPKVFGPRGGFLREIGGRGQGPLEFERATGIYADAEEHVHVFDVANGRETVLNEDFTIVREERLPFPLLAVAPLPGERYVANGAVYDPDRLGHPLHVVDGAQIVASFGAARDRASRVGQNRKLAVDSFGRIYASELHEYFIEIWTDKGRRIRGLERPGLWRPRGQFESLALSAENPVPPAAIQAIRVDRTGRLWVMAWLPTEDALDHIHEVQRPDGRIDMRWDSVTEVYRTVIEVIDPWGGVIVARSEFDELLGGFLADGMAYGPLTSELGGSSVAVYAIALSVNR